MATNSDFAQKLLRDLRLRKERMAASQRSSSHSALIARGSTNEYTNRGQSHRGHRPINSLDSVGSSTLKSYSRSNGGNRSLNLQESSTQIVAYGKDRSTSNVGDLSKAFAFALKNGRKGASANNPMINFLHHIGWRSMEDSSFQKHRPSNQFPTYSYFHVKEISKGVQNLNQILRACSNGLNFDRYSIEIGKDLLKGAMDLEESLRMLVNLQEASEYMVTPQRKNRIRLLEEDEEEEEQNMIMTHKRQLMELPRFSFDKPSRNSYQVKEVAKTDFKRLLALTYEIEQPKQQAPTSNNVPHKSSLQSEKQKHSSSPQSGMRKGRISNVIAKLMGLNELPEKVESKTVQKDRNSKKKEEMILKKIATADTALQGTDGTKNIVPPTANKKRIQGGKIPQSTPNSMSASKAENDLQFADRANAGGSKRLTSTLDKEREEENYYTKNREKEMTEKLETKEKSANDKLRRREMQKQRSSEAENMLKESIDRKGTSPTTEKNKSEMLLRRNQQQTSQKCASQEPKHHLRNEMFQSRKINGSQAESYGTTRLSRKQQIVPKKQPLVNQAISSTRSSKERTDAVHSKELSISKHHGNRNKDESPTNYTEKIDSSQRDLKYEIIKAKADVPQSVQRKSVRVSASQKKVGSAQVHSKQAPERKHEVFPRTKGILPNSTMTSKHEVSILQEMKQSKKEEINVLKKGDMKFMGFSHLEASIQPPTGVEILNETELTGFENKAGGDECQRLNLLQTLAPNEHGRDELPEASKVCADYGDKEPVSIEHAEQNFAEACPNFCIGSDRGNIEFFYSSLDDYERISTLGAEEPFTEPEKVKHETVSCSEAQEFLTRSENHLKETLTRSEFFTDTAKALFKLKTPTGQALNATGYTCQDDNSKLILDCAYEVMKRLGTRQELAANPYLKISVSCIQVNSLDELIKQLHKDIESLQYYGGNGSQECDPADSLYKMLEKDVQNRVPNVNSMWDFSWDRMMFASFEKCDVTWDLERYLLNGLLDEMTKDLLSMHPSCPLELQRGINGSCNLMAPDTPFK